MKNKLKNSATTKEIKALLPFYIGGRALMLLICVPLMLGGVGDYTLVTGTIAGTLVSVGVGRIKPEELKGIIDSKNRENAGPTAPACGLFLREVFYPWDMKKE